MKFKRSPIDTKCFHTLSFRCLTLAFHPSNRSIYCWLNNPITFGELAFLSGSYSHTILVLSAVSLTWITKLSFKHISLYLSLKPEFTIHKKKGNAFVAKTQNLFCVVNNILVIPPLSNIRS